MTCSKYTVFWTIKQGGLQDVCEVGEVREGEGGIRKENVRMWVLEAVV